MRSERHKQISALDLTFKIARALEVAIMIAIIGMAANFVAQMVSAKVTPPSVLIATVSIVSVLVIYCMVTFILYVDKQLPFLLASIMDACIMTMLAVLTIVIGKPLSYLDCTTIGKISSKISNVYSFTHSLLDGDDDSSNQRREEYGHSNAKRGLEIKYKIWIGSTKSTCLEMKSIWGLCIGLCILFFLSSVIVLSLWKKNGGSKKRNDKMQEDDMYMPQSTRLPQSPVFSPIR